MDLKKSSLIANALAVPSQTTVWTNNFRWGYSKNFAVQLICASASSPAVRVQLEMSYKPLSINGATDLNEGASSIYYVVPDSFADIFSDIVDKVYHIKGINPPYAVYGRYKLTGLTGNPSDTTITIYNMIQDAGRSFGA